MTSRAVVDVTCCLLMWCHVLLVVVCRPSESKVKCLTPSRDCLPDNRQIYALELTYNHTLTKTTEVSRWCDCSLRPKLALCLVDWFTRLTSWQQFNLSISYYPHKPPRFRFITYLITPSLSKHGVIIMWQFVNHSRETTIGLEKFRFGLKYWV